MAVPAPGVVPREHHPQPSSRMPLGIRCMVERGGQSRQRLPEFTSFGHVRGKASGGSNPALQVSGHPLWVTLPVRHQPFPGWLRVLLCAKPKGAEEDSPHPPAPPFKHVVPHPIKSLLVFGLSSSLSSSCPASPSASISQGKGLSSMESPPCLGTMGTCRLGLSCQELHPSACMDAGHGAAPSSSGAEHHSFCQTRGS